MILLVKFRVRVLRDVISYSNSSKNGKFSQTWFKRGQFLLKLLASRLCFKKGFSLDVCLRFYQSVQLFKITFEYPFGFCHFISNSARVHTHTHTHTHTFLVMLQVSSLCWWINIVVIFYFVLKQFTIYLWNLNFYRL